MAETVVECIVVVLPILLEINFQPTWKKELIDHFLLVLEFLMVHELAVRYFFEKGPTITSNCATVEYSKVLH